MLRAGPAQHEDLAGLELSGGTAEAAIALLQRMIDRAAGDLLADGVMRAAQRMGEGSERFAIHAGGQELPAHDPRHEPDFGLAYKMSPTPGRHTQGGVDVAGMSAEDKVAYGIDPRPGDPRPGGLPAIAYVAGAAWLNVLNAAGSVPLGR